MALAWVYTLVGADGRQLATYNGLQGNLCQRNAVRLWPVEFNTYGPNNTRIITRADGTSEVVISDYLGSARVTLSTTAEPLQSTSYHPYGTERSNVGSGSRTSYIGREHDKETELGFYGVRLYEPEYGRFLSTDVLWGKYLSLQTYHYCRNNPIVRTDRTGMADFFDENGKLAGTDGVDDGYKFIGNREVYNEAIAAGINWEMMGGQQGIYQLPSAQVLNDIETNVLGPLKGRINDDTRREYGGVVGDNGQFYSAPPGPIATGESQYPEINLGPALADAAKAGSNAVIYVHSHVNFELKDSRTNMKGTSNPSVDDRKMLNPAKLMQYGMLLYPKFPWRTSSIVFFGPKKSNGNGTTTDVTTDVGTVKKIVGGDGK